MLQIQTRRLSCLLGSKLQFDLVTAWHLAAFSLSVACLEICLLSAVVHSASNLLTIQLHCQFTQVCCDSLFPSFKHDAFASFSIHACHDLVQHKLIPEVTKFCRITDPLPILLYSATASEEYTSNKALSELQDCHFPFRHINSMLGSPGGNSMLWFSGCSRPRSNQNHFTSLSMPGVRLGNHVLRLEPFRCDVFSDPTGEVQAYWHHTPCEVDSWCHTRIW